MKLSKEVASFLVQTIRKYITADQCSILLFGSYANGSATEFSDIDIALKGSAPIDPGSWQKIESAIEESYIPQKIDLLDYARVAESFQAVIDQTSIDLEQ